MRNLAIDAERLWGEIMETATIGGTPKGGICRLTLTDLDRQVRDWFKARAEKLGCRVTTDDMGAMFARRAGTADVPPIAIGSHLDTQPTGGKFDGVLGVLGALEALRTLHEAGYETYAPIEVVNWTNEEGSRFAPAMVASGVFAKVFERDWAAARQDRDGVTFGEALEAIGYRGLERCGEHPLSAFFELHIEQGPILETEGRDIGVVEGVQGIRWYEITISGQDAHAGPTPMERRKDALVGVSEMVLAVNRIGMSNLPNACATVGMMQVSPNSRNVIPGKVFFTVDFRHPDAGILQKMGESFKAECEKIVKTRKLEMDFQEIWYSPPVKFADDCIAAVKKATDDLGFSNRRIISGAGHDSVYMSRVTPTSMIFVPCKDGISHNEIEDAKQTELAAGCDVLLRAIIERANAV